MLLKRGIVTDKMLVGSLAAGFSFLAADHALCFDGSKARRESEDLDTVCTAEKPDLSVLPTSARSAIGHDQDTYIGRLLRLTEIMDPRNVTVSTAEARRCQTLLQAYQQGGHCETAGTSKTVLQRAEAVVSACCNPVSGEVIPPPFRMSGFLLCNVPIIAAMVFTTSIPVQVISHWVNQSLNTAVNYYNRSGAGMDQATVIKSYALAVGTACPLAFGLGKVFHRAPPMIRRFSFAVSYIAVAAAGTANVVFTRGAEVMEGVAVRDETGKTVLSRSLLLPIPVVMLPVGIVGAVQWTGLMPTNPRAKLFVQLVAITACLGVGLPMCIATFPQEVTFAAEDLELEFQHMERMDGSGIPVEKLFANKGL